MTGDKGYASLPLIRRARGFRLYDSSGRRYLDMYQDGGAAVLGHRPEGMLLALKSAASRGLWGTLPSRESGRLYRAVDTLLDSEELPLRETVFGGAAQLRFFRNTERLLSAFGLDELVDPLFLSPGETAARAASGKAALLWRPFTGELWDRLSPSLAAAGVGRLFVIPLLPLPGGFAPRAALVLGRDSGDLPPDDALSAAVTGISAHSTTLLKKLIAVSESVKRNDNLLSGRDLRERFSRPPWRREGPYLLWDRPEGEYESFRSSALERGIVLAPDPLTPSILPLSCTAGEIKPLISLMEELYGNL
jgi:hypothetical protein